VVGALKSRSPDQTAPEGNSADQYKMSVEIEDQV